ncbi:hypothetical protein BC826DRAFT_1059228 [Russula brevipes]|nr:hypothetical protein BC826DRAFT_1059228 [Russula brevipes]
MSRMRGTTKKKRNIVPKVLLKSGPGGAKGSREGIRTVGGGDDDENDSRTGPCHGDGDGDGSLGRCT